MRKTVCAGVKRSPSIAFRSFGTTFHVTGTAATQYSRTAPRADGPPAATDVIAPVASSTRTAPARAASASARGPLGAETPVTPAGSSPDHGVTTTVPPMSGPWIQQKNLYVPGVENVTRDARGSPIGDPDVSSVTKKPLPCIVFPA